MYQDYLHFSEEELIADEYFRQWVHFPDAGNRAFWEGFITAYPEKRSLVFSAKAFLEHLSIQSVQPTAAQVELSLAKSLQKISALEYSGLPRKTWTRKRKAFLSWAVAAGLLVAVATTLFLVSNSKEVTIETEAGAAQIRTLKLPDGSMVMLNAGSHLTYEPDMQHASVREVWLEGEAFFDVKHLQKKGAPQRFVVHVDDMDIEVLGTTFNVKKLGEFTNVSLNTGRIKIGLKGDAETFIELQPGDLVRYSSKAKHFLKKQVKPELFSVWKDEKLSLDNMTVAEIARLLEDAYGYKVHLEEKGLAETMLSGTLRLKNEAAILEALAFSLDIDIIQKDHELYLQYKTKQ